VLELRFLPQDFSPSPALEVPSSVAYLTN
jgi:hypothetical protein